MRRIFKSALALAVTLGVLVATAPLKAGPYEDALTRFAADSYSETDAAIGGVAASGNALAEEVIRALQDGRLLASPSSKIVAIRDAAGALKDAATGQPLAAAPGDL